MGQGTPTEEEVRKIVSGVVEELLGDGTDLSGRAPEPSTAPRTTSANAAPDDKTVAIGADHGGFPLKEELIAFLRDRGFSVTDCGTFSTEACDYPDFAHEVALRVAGGFCRAGILVDGAGIGSCMAANKVPGIRAALAYDLSSARNSREHNHANVLTLGSGLIGPSLARQIVETWLATPWGLDRHARRVAKISQIERKYLTPAFDGSPDEGGKS